ncbi:DUF3348 domain-containing protein [Ideonella sp. A 288]|uniref:DUF3348 domain-containing protein n=1 Tax=Ideonella sp. A 288 TaxID=1962181 RepID=UPI000B4BF63A|nr:DUF3348 domain-containing protein [Ideonella sp. A 288]
MAPALPRKSRNGSRLVRLLADMATAEVAESTQPFAERLGLWLDWTDAIALSAVVQGEAASRPQQAARTTTTVSVRSVADQLARVRLDLTRALTTDASRSTGRAGTAASRTPTTVVDDGDANDFAPHRRRYQAHQRAMETKIKPLRAEARAALAGQSPSGGQLAAFDAVLEEALAAREQHLLSTVPRWLEQHFARLRAAHASTEGGDERPAGSGTSTPPAAWLAAYRRDMHEVLLAELDVRLQPVEGLLEALLEATGNEVTEGP